MKRREFLAASAAAAFGLVASDATRGAEGTLEKEFLELRLYHFASTAKQTAFDDFLASAVIPALNRLGIGPVGVFKMLKKDNEKLAEDSTDLYVLLPHQSMDSYVSLNQRLGADREFVEAAEGFLRAPMKDPAYKRYESTLMVAFDQCPKVEVPTKAATRLMQLRIYESHNEERAWRKVHMFNEGGEIALFRRCGLHPVFFGSAIIGDKLPNLTYMVGFEDEKAQKKAWDTFVAHPEWKKLAADEMYKDTVSNITNLVLRPAASSQI